MAFLKECEHDIFVSYAHSDLLNDWSRRLIEDTRKLVAGGLRLREDKQVGVWMDYKISGHQPLTEQLRAKVSQSGLLLVLMSEWYLESSWCRDEVEWFVDAVRQKRAGRPLFVVRVRSTDHATWPDVFKDERGHPLPGYDFVRAVEDNPLGLPKGYPSPEAASDDKDYYAEVSKLASDIVAEMNGLAQASQPGEVAQPARASGLREAPARQERVCLAAAPAEDVDDLRDELAGLLRARGCTIVPEANPVDGDEVQTGAGEWVTNCDKFVQVLGTVSGAWRHDDTGFVMYQHQLARNAGKPIFVYRAPSLETSRVKKREYRDFLEQIDQGDSGDLQSFAEQVTKIVEAPLAGGESPRSVFMMASARDEILEREIRRLLAELDIAVFPLARSARGGRELASVLDEGSSFLKIVRRCGAILLINGNVKAEEADWIDGRWADIKFDIQRKVDGRLKCAIVDAPMDPRLEPFEDVSVFSCDSPTLKHDLLGWLGMRGEAGPTAGHVT